MKQNMKKHETKYQKIKNDKKTPEKRATEAFQVGRRIFEDFDCLPATFWDTLDAPIQLQNESRNHLQIGTELSPETASEMDQK